MNVDLDNDDVTKTTPLLECDYEDLKCVRSVEDGKEKSDISLMEDVEESKKSKELNGGGICRLLKMAKSEIPCLLTGCVVLLIRLPFSLSIPHFVAGVIGALTNENFSKAKETVVLLIVFGTIDALLDFWCVYLFGRAKEKIVLKIRMDAFKAMLRQELAFFDDTKSGELASRLTNDCGTMAGNLTWFFRFSIEAFVRVSSISVYMTMRCPKLACCTLIVIPIIASINKKYGDWLSRNSRDVQAIVAESNSVAQETFSNIKTVLGFAAEEFQSCQYQTKIDENFRLQMKQVKASGIYYMAISTFLMNTCLQAAILSIGAYMISQHDLTPEVLLAFMLYQGQLQQWTNQLFDSYSSLLSSSGAGDKVFQILDRKPRLPGTGNVEQKKAVSTSISRSLSSNSEIITFQNVHFTYPSRPCQPVLQNINFKVQEGSTIALVGPSGCGKSTIVSLLERLYDPDQGIIEFEGIDLRNKDIIAHRRYDVGIVSQEPSLFSGTILENITYGSFHTTKLDAVQASKLANAHDFILKFPDDYNTQVGEHGLQLSGGQKQRISIARAIVKKPKLLLLDEATSALDTESEQLVQDALDSLLHFTKNKMTTVVVAHRLQTIRNADCIVVMQPLTDGSDLTKSNIVEIGSHDQLMKIQHGFYRQMISSADDNHSQDFILQD